ncbi:protein-disulfide reductase DsbD family protein [Altererythrobacter sp. CAU 1778]
MRARILAYWSALIAALLAALLASPLLAQPNDANLSAELVVEGPARPGDTLELALVFTPRSAEWHGYWRNPGDAGFGMSLDWALPPGWQAGEPQYPVPKRLVVGGLMNHIYEGQYAVLVPLSVPASAAAETAVPIAVTADYLACTDKICVPQRAQLQAMVSVQGDGGWDERFAAWQARIPAQLDSTARFALTDDRLRLAIPIPASLDIGEPHLFIGTEQLADYAAAQAFSRTGDLLVAEIPRSALSNAPDTVEGILAFGAEGQGVRFFAEAGEVPPLGEPLGGGTVATPSLLLLLGGALLGGLLLNIMPCVFPILSLKALSLARAGESAGHARQEGLAYTAGVVLACVALGALMLLLRAGGEQVGWAFQLQEPGVVVALLVLAVAITANLLGIYELPGLSVTRGGEPASAFSTGLLAAFVATPCTGPFMAAALGAALLLPAPYALLLFATMGLGLALPFLALGFVPRLRALLPKPGPWMERFRRIMAVPMGLTALALVWLTARLGGRGFGLMAMVLVFGVLLALVVVGRLQRAGKLAWPAFGLIVAPFLIFAAFALPASIETRVGERDAGLLAAQPFSADALAEATAAGRPVFVWMTADWCVTCKVNENVAIEREAVRDAFAANGVRVLRGDWTRRDPEITAYLEAQGAAGVPLYVWYVPGASPQQLPQILAPDALTSLAEALPAARSSGGSR